MLSHLQICTLVVQLHIVNAPVDLWVSDLEMRITLSMNVAFVFQLHFTVMFTMR